MLKKLETHTIEMQLTTSAEYKIPESLLDSNCNDNPHEIDNEIENSMEVISYLPPELLKQNESESLLYDQEVIHALGNAKESVFLLPPSFTVSHNSELRNRFREEIESEIASAPLQEPKIDLVISIDTTLTASELSKNNYRSIKVKKGATLTIGDGVLSLDELCIEGTLKSDQLNIICHVIDVKENGKISGEIINMDANSIWNSGEIVASDHMFVKGDRFFNRNYISCHSGRYALNEACINTGYIHDKSILSLTTPVLLNLWHIRSADPNINAPLLVNCGLIQSYRGKISTVASLDGIHLPCLPDEMPGVKDFFSYSFDTAITYGKSLLWKLLLYYIPIIGELYALSSIYQSLVQLKLVMDELYHLYYQGNDVSFNKTDAIDVIFKLCNLVKSMDQAAKKTIELIKMSPSDIANEMASKMYASIPENFDDLYGIAKYTSSDIVNEIKMYHESMLPSLTRTSIWSANGLTVTGNYCETTIRSSYNVGANVAYKSSYEIGKFVNRGVLVAHQAFIDGQGVIDNSDGYMAADQAYISAKKELDNTMGQIVFKTGFIESTNDGDMLGNIDASSVVLKNNKIFDVNGLLSATAYTGFTVSDSLTYITDNAVNIDREINRSCAVNLVASQIDINADCHSDTSFSFDATSGFLNVNKNITAVDDILLSGRDGVKLSSYNVYTTQEVKKKHRVYKKKTTVTSTTHVDNGHITSDDGKIIIASSHGEVHGIATNLNAKNGSDIYAKEDIKLYALKGKVETHSHKSYLGGLAAHSKDAIHEFTEISDITGNGQSRLHSYDGYIDVNGYKIKENGQLYLAAKKGITLSAGVLDHYTKEVKKGFHINNAAIDSISALVQGQDPLTVLETQSPLVSNSHQLLESDNPTQLIVNGANVAMAGCNLAIGDNVDLNQAVMENAGLGDASGFNPLARISYQRTSNESHYQTVDSSAIEAGSLVVDTDGKFELNNGLPLTVYDNAYIRAGEGVYFQGVKLNYDTNYSKKGAYIDVDFSGHVRGAGVNANKYHVSGDSQINQQTYVGGRLYLDDLPEFVLDSANMTVGSIAGHVETLKVISHQNTSSAKSSNLSVGSAGQMALGHSHTKYKDTVVSGVSVLGSNDNSSLTVNQANLTGAYLMSEHENILNINSINSESVRDEHSEKSMEFSGNYKDFGIKNQNKINTVGFDYGKSHYVAENRSSLFSKKNNNSPIGYIVGELITNPSDPKIIIKDKKTAIHFDVPINMPNRGENRSQADHFSDAIDECYTESESVAKKSNEYEIEKPLFDADHNQDVISDAIEPEEPFVSLDFMPLYSLKNEHPYLQADEYHSLTFDDYVDAFYQGTEASRINLINTITHPIDALYHVGLMAWDGWNEMSYAAFGVGNEESRERNRIRSQKFFDGIDRLKNGDELTWLQVTSEIVPDLMVAGVVNIGAQALPAVLLKNIAPSWKTGTGYQSVQFRQARMLKEGGYNVSPESTFNNYDHIGRSGTFITDKKQITDVLGNSVDFGAGAKMNVGYGGDFQTIPPSQVRNLEYSLGLELGSLNEGFRITPVTDLSLESGVFCPTQGNRFFKLEKGLPGGGPELVVPSIPTNRWPVR